MNWRDELDLGLTWSRLARLPAMLLLVLAAALAFGCNGDDPDNPGDDPGDDPGEDGDLPELWVSQARLQGSSRVDWIYIQPGSCSIGDSCTEASGWRRAVRFSTEIQNRGEAALLLGGPEDGKGLVVLDSCRARTAVAVAPLQELIDSQGNVVRATRARPYCWADTTRVADMEGPETAGHPVSHITCATNQGISVGWSSIQGSNLDCQLLDVTGLPSGEYVLRLTVDPDGMLKQKSHEGAIAEVSVLVRPIEDHQACLPDGSCHTPVVGACEGVSCPGGSAPVARCEEGDVAVVIEGPGLCHPVDGTCIEVRGETRCADLGLTCRDGACVDLCEDMGCTAPADYCVGNVAVTHSGVSCDRETGECLEPNIAEVDCGEIERVCVDGACVNLCRDVDCSGGRSCLNGQVLVEGPGACDWSTGLCVSGESEVVPCPEEEVCEEGRCVDLCRNVACPGELFCEDGLLVDQEAGGCDWRTGDCIPGEREITSCGEDEVCEDGRCVPEP